MPRRYAFGWNHFTPVEFPKLHQEKVLIGRAPAIAVREQSSTGYVTVTASTLGINFGPLNSCDQRVAPDPIGRRLTWKALSSSHTTPPRGQRSLPWS